MGLMVASDFATAIWTCRYSSNLVSQIGSQLAFDQLSTGLRRAHDTRSQVCVQAGDLVCDWNGIWPI